MSENSRIYWFSGTGNSLYAAKQLAAALGGTQLVQITNEMPLHEAVGGKGEEIGFVFPSYYCNIPRAVHALVEKLDIKPDTYIFAVVTMGGPGQGSVAAMKKALKARGLRLNYGRGLSMPANNVLLYNPADPNKGETMRNKVDERLHAFASDIQARKQVIKSHPFILRNHFKNIETLDTPFKVSNNCTSCGLCKKICPVGNIKMDETTKNKPEWLHRCEVCVACISWCPAKAIDYGEKTKSRRRYHNPNIKVEELLRKDEKIRSDAQ